MYGTHGTLLPESHENHVLIVLAHKVHEERRAHRISPEQYNVILLTGILTPSTTAQGLA
jgi:hypothetical protein